MLKLLYKSLEHSWKLVITSFMRLWSLSHVGNKEKGKKLLKVVYKLIEINVPE